MKPDKIHVVRNEAVPKLPNKPAFDELATRAALHLATPWWSHWLTYTGAGVAVVASVVGVTQYNTSAKEAGPAKTAVVLTTSENTLTWKHPYDTLLVDVLHGDTVMYKNCTQIIVPAGSILSKNGGKINGKTKLLYRELRRPAEMIAAGLTSEYQSGKAMLLLESNGIFDIKPLENEQISSENPMSISFCTNHAQAGNYWFSRNERKNTWIYQKDAVYKKNKVERLLPAVDGIAEVKDQKTQDMEKPVRPRMKNPKNHSFQVDVGNIPELRKYTNVTFEVIPGQKYFPEDLPDELDAIKVSKTGTPGVYYISMYDNSIVHRYYAAPVFENEVEYLKALEQYKIELAEYKRRSGKKDTASFTIFSEEKTLAECKIEISTFGIYQVAKPTSQGDIAITANCATSENKKIRGPVWQIFYNRNCVRQLQSDSLFPIHFSSADRCAFIAAGGNHEVAIFDAGTAAKMKQLQKHPYIALQPVDRGSSTLYGFHRYIYIQNTGPQ